MEECMQTAAAAAAAEVTALTFEQYTIIIIIISCRLDVRPSALPCSSVRPTTATELFLLCAHSN